MLHHEAKTETANILVATGRDYRERVQLGNLAEKGSMKRQILRHYVATLSYRASKAIDEVPSGFPTFAAGSGVRSPLEILSHMGDVLTFTLRRLLGDDSIPGEPATANSWDDEVARFRSLLREISAALDTMSSEQSGLEEGLLQGPFSDVMCHIGQLSMLRRMAGAPIKGENFFEADISVENLNGI